MPLSDLDHFIAESTALARAHAEPADCVAAIAPLMHGLMHALLSHADGFLAPQRPRADPDHGARNMNSFHLCDVAAGTRRRVSLAHNGS